MIALTIAFVALIVAASSLQRLRVFAPLTLFIVFVFFGVIVRGWYLVLSRSSGLLEVSLSGRDAYDSIVIATFHIFVAATFVALGYVCGSRRTSSIYSQYSFSQANVTVFSGRLIGLSILSIIAICLFVVLGADGDGISHFISRLQSRTVDVLRGRGYLRLLLDLAIVSAVTAYAASRGISDKVARNVASLAAGLVFLGLLFLGGRGLIVQYVLSLCLVGYLLATREKARRAAAERRALRLSVGVAAIALMAIVIGLASRQSNQQQIAFSLALSDVIDRFWGSVTSAIPLVDSYALAVVYSDMVGHDYGRHFVHYASRFIPRTLWETKPDLLGIEIRRQFWGDSLGGIPPTYFGEFYISFGFLGVLFSALFYGIALRAISSTENRARQDVRYLASYSVLLPIIVFTVSRSGFEVAFMTITIYALIIVSIHRILFLAMKR